MFFFIKKNYFDEGLISTSYCFPPLLFIFQSQRRDNLRPCELNSIYIINQENIFFKMEKNSLYIFNLIKLPFRASISYILYKYYSVCHMYYVVIYIHNIVYLRPIGLHDKHLLGEFVENTGVI